MTDATIIIAIANAEISDTYDDIIGVDVEIDDELAGMFKLRLGMSLQEDNTWSYLDDERFAIWNPVVIRVGFGEADEEIFSGYITHVKPIFNPDPENVMLEIWGMDKSVLLDREEILKAWPSKKDSDIATEIFNLYGLTPMVEDTTLVHDEEVSTIIQRETDMQFLKRLALRNGYECYVQGDIGYFQSPVIDADNPQPVLSVHFGHETTLNFININVNALSPSNVAMFQVNRMSKETIDVIVESSQQTELGGMNAQSLLSVDVAPAKNYVARNCANGDPEMTDLCQGLFHHAEWFVTAEAEVSATLYAHILLPRATVTVKGIGETYSGVYYVNHVTHSFNPDGYNQRIKLKRNGLMLTGNESFAVDTGLLDAIGL